MASYPPQRYPLLLRLDPNTHALVAATALIASVTFAIFAMNVIAAMLTWFYL